MFEISKVYDSNVYNHQVELAQKTEEITRLQRKLLRAESKLREGLGRGPQDTITIEDDDESSSDDITEIHETEIRETEIRETAIPETEIPANEIPENEIPEIVVEGKLHSLTTF